MKQQFTVLAGALSLTLFMSGCQTVGSTNPFMMNCKYKDAIYEAYNWHCVVGDQNDKTSCETIKLIEISTGKFPGAMGNEQAIVFWREGADGALKSTAKVVNDREIMTCNDWSMIFENRRYREIFTILGSNTVYSFGPRVSNAENSRVKLRPISESDASKYRRSN